MTDKGDGSVADVLAGRARWTVVCGDAAEVLATIGDGACSALVTDPPSGIAFMGAEWDRDKGGRAQWVAWLAGILGDARRCVRNGGRAFVWSLPRTSHWTGCAVEDAGWSIEATVQHLFGTGWPKGKSQLKPAAETWWLARNGRSEALNIDACRVGATKRVPGGAPSQAPNNVYGKASPRREDEEGRDPNVGRYPPNVVFSHAPGCVRAGQRKAARNIETGARHDAASVSAYGNGVNGRSTTGVVEIIEAWKCAEGCPVAELDAQSGELTSGTECVTYGDTGGASRFFPCFPVDPAVYRYIAKPSAAEKTAGAEVADHPTAKSIALMRWLVDLVTQRGDVVLDPFAGSGTTGAACLASGRRVILVEREPRFAEIARQRCAHWGAEWSSLAKVSLRRAKRAKDDEKQPSLFGGAR